MDFKKFVPYLLGAVAGVVAWEYLGVKNLVGGGASKAPDANAFANGSGYTAIMTMDGRRMGKKGMGGKMGPTTTTQCWCAKRDGTGYIANCAGDKCNCCPQGETGTLYGY